MKYGTMMLVYHIQKKFKGVSMNETACFFNNFYSNTTNNDTRRAKASGI